MLALNLLALAALVCGSTYGHITTVRERKHNKYVACYFQSWAIYRNGEGIFQIQDIKAEYCTHLIYSFAGLNGDNFEVKVLDRWADLDEHNGRAGFKKLTQLRYQYKDYLKGVYLAVGGWNEGSYNYSEMARSPSRRRTFVRSAVHFLRTHNFQGLDLDWEFPTTRGGSPDDRHNFVILLQELKRAFREHDLKLTAAISADVESMESRYDIRKIADYLDRIHVMTYDYHGLEGQVVMPNAPLHEVNNTLNYLLGTGVNPEKLILGLPTYGKSYVLEENLRAIDENPIGKRSLKTSWPGPYSNQEGFLGYNEICRYFTLNTSWIRKWDNLTSTPYAIHHNQVIVYDDANSLRDKVHLAVKKGLGGVMIWSIDTDDFRGDCGPEHTRGRADAYPYRYPLLQAITDALEKNSSVRAGQPSALHLGLLLSLVSLLATRLISIH